MARQVPPKQSKSRFWLGCGIAVILALFLILAAAITLIYLNSRNWQKELALHVNIVAPETGLQVELQSPVVLQAEGTNPGGITRMELYADGALIAAQDSPEVKGENPLILGSIWTPLTTGRHVLLARGYSRENKFSDSNVVYVDVSEATAKPLDIDGISHAEGSLAPSLADIAAAYGITPDELIRLNPSLSGTDPTAPLPPGTRIDPPPAPGGGAPGGGTPPSPPPPPPGTPAAPSGLRASADCTAATLNWTNSPDATSYRVYRLGPGDTRPRVVGSPAAGAVTFHDTLPPAAGAQVYRYQVAAVRAGREGLSLMVTATTPAGCTGAPAPSGTASDLMLTVAMVDTDAVWDGVYCYLSVNSNPYERIPAGDSTILSPERANNRYYNLTRLPGGGRYNMAGHPTSSPVTLRGDCRGRRGPRTELLGRFSISHPQADWNGTLRSASGGSVRFSYCLGPASRPCTPVIPGAVPTPGIIIDLSEILFYLPPPTNLRLANSTLACSEITDPIDRLACSSSGIFCVLFGTCEGRRTLLWDWTGTVFVPESSLTGYTVYRTTTDMTTGSRMTITWDVNRRGDGTLPKVKLAEEADLRCGNRVEYRLRARQASRMSVMSDPISFDTPLCPNAARVEITFQAIQITHVDDRGEFCIFCPGRDTEIEPIGNISARGGSLPWTQRIFSLSPVSMGVGTRNWSSINLYTPPFGPGGTNNNVFRLDITNPASDSLLYDALITDVDHYDIWGHITQTVFCNVTGHVPAHSVEEWGRFNETFTMTDNRNPEADCNITVNVRGFPVRR